MTQKFTCLVMPAAGLQLQATDDILPLPNQTIMISRPALQTGVGAGSHNPWSYLCVMSLLREYKF